MNQVNKNDFLIYISSALLGLHGRGPTTHKRPVAYFNYLIWAIIRDILMRLLIRNNFYGIQFRIWAA
jgi:hypothetical protein